MEMKQLIPLLISVFGFVIEVSAQTIDLNSQGVTRAVVIGISDYQDENIPDLQFADRDAKAFVDYLRSAAGGKVSNDNIRLLLNNEATNGHIVEELGWLIDESKEGEEVIIYFSGHSDVEKKTIFQPGFLLCWDAPANVYMAGGTFDLRNLQDVISTLSLKNKAKVIVITDACRAGKLAGNNIGGVQLSNANLAERFANEIKILSCQPTENSIEGEQWGGGRGAFSYHLIDGLYGFADTNKDSKVTLSEIDRYLEDKVTVEAKPHEQNPMTIGNKTEVLSEVDENLLASIRDNKPFTPKPFSEIDQKGFVESVLAQVDTNIIDLYNSFLTAVENKEFFEPKATCADTLYSQLILIPELEPLHNHMRRNYAAALQDDSQQMINRMLFQPEKEIGIWHSSIRMHRIYGRYPKMLDRAAELLGEEHYMYPVFKARKAFFEGGIIYLARIRLKDISNGQKALDKFKESLSWQPNAPHVYFWMANTFHWNMEQIDSAEYYIKKAIEFAPGWSLPLYDHIRNLSQSLLIEKARSILDTLQNVDSTDIQYWTTLGAFSFFQGQYAESSRLWGKVFEMDSTAYFYYYGKIICDGFLGKEKEALEIFNVVIKIDSLSPFPYYHIGNMYYVKGAFQEAIPYFEKAIALDSFLIWPYSQLGDTYTYLKEYDKAEEILLKGFLLDSTYMQLINALGGVYAGKGELSKAEYYYSKAIELSDVLFLPYYNLAMVQSRQHKTKEAIENLDIFLKKGGKRYFDHIQSNTDLDPLRDLPEYKTMMKKHFPDKFKD